MSSSVAPNCTTASRSSADQFADGFAQWARDYDAQPNPLLALEERYLSQLMPQVRDLNVVDLGCGTGRWLHRLASQNPRSLTGIDGSPEMLERAAQKLGSFANLLLSDWQTLPVSDASSDIVLACFVLSYVANLERFVAEVQRILQNGGRVFLSDAYAETIRSCNWKRAFRVGQTSIELKTYERSLEQVLSCFEAFGFKTVCVLTPEFGPPEEAIFRESGKSDAFVAAVGHPATYVVELRTTGSYPRASGRRRRKSDLAISEARIAISAKEAIKAELVIEEGRVASLDCRSSAAGQKPESELDLSGYLVLPGLINSHDHLEFGLFPNLGRGSYRSAREWALEIQHSESATIQQQHQIPETIRLWWGGIRNLLCGVTTVCHHNPIKPEVSTQEFPVRVLKRFRWAHSLSFDADLVAKLRANDDDVPFILHLGEGCDSVSAKELYTLDQAQALDGRTVIVHGLALDDDGVALLNRRGAALVWCPTSNEFLFGRTHDGRFLARVDNVVLGSDSPLTAAGDLLDEIRFAYHRAQVTPDQIYQMLFTNPAKIFRLDQGEGRIRSGSMADLIAVADTATDPAGRIAQLSPSDIELVILGGRVRLASEHLFRRLPGRSAAGMYPLEVDERLVWITAPLPRLFEAVAPVLGREFAVGGKRVRDASANRN